MSTKWISPTWRIPEESNQSKFDNYSLDFDGTGHISLSSSIDLGTKSTISFWIRNQVSQDRTILGEDSYGSDYIVYGGYNNFIFRIGASYMVFTTGSTPIIPINGDWAHLVFVRDEDNVTCYINGSSIGSSSTWTGGSPSSTTTKFDTIGAKSSASNFTVGKINQVSGFDYTLSQSQVDYLYNSGTPQNPMALTPAPITYYPLGGSSTGSASTLTVPNESVPSATVFNFDTQDYIQYPHVNINGAFTVSTWVKTTDTNTYGNLFSSSNQFGGGANILNNWKLMRWSRAARFNGSDSSNSIIFDVNTGTSGTRPNLYDGNWHHVLAIWDGTTNADGIKIFFDGVLKGLGTASSTAINTDSSIPIRAGSSSATFDFIGEQSNQQIWNIALTYGSASADGSVWNSVLNQWEIIDYAN